MTAMDGPAGDEAETGVDGPADADVVEGARRPRATMRDVAALAGVSLKTVSRVINREPGVSSPLVAQVERAVAQLDYRPNMSASSLRRGDGKTAAIAAVLEDLANPFSASLLRALEDTAHERGVLIFAGSIDEDPRRERDLVRAFTMRRADGIVIAPTGDDQSYLAADMRAGTPVVFVDRPARGLSADAVVADNVSGAQQAVRHLAAHGHRRIAYLGDWLAIPTARQRHQGYREACLDLGLTTRPDHTVHDLRSVDAAEAAVTGLLRADEPPDRAVHQPEPRDHRRGPSAATPRPPRPGGGRGLRRLPPGRPPAAAGHGGGAGSRGDRAHRGVAGLPAARRRALGAGGAHRPRGADRAGGRDPAARRSRELAHGDDE